MGGGSERGIGYIVMYKHSNYTNEFRSLWMLWKNIFWRDDFELRPGRWENFKDEEIQGKIFQGEERTRSKVNVLCLRNKIIICLKLGVTDDHGTRWHSRGKFGLHGKSFVHFT